MTQLSQYDAANNLVSQTSYGRDRVGNITSQTDASGASSYTLDALYRLSTANYPGTANDELFTFDKVGNIKTATRGSVTATANTRYYNYTAGTNRLADIRIGSASGTVESSFTNDFEGRLTAQTGLGAKTLTWDAKGRVKTVGAETYSYDPMDYRIGRSGGSLGNRSYFLEGEHLESEYSGAQLQAKYFRGSSVDELVAAWMFDTDSKLKPFLFHHDQITSVTAISGHNGGTTQSVKYSAFGTVQSSTGSSPNRLRFTGREDDGTGLMYFRGRYLDPAIKRFVSEDSLGFASGDMSFYVYGANNPVNNNDPMGTDPVSTIVRGVAKVGGRLGNAETRAHVKQVAQEWVDKGWNLVSGGGGRERLIPGPSGGAKGGAYGDIVLEKNGQRKILNTVDTYAGGITPTAREVAAGNKIRSLEPTAEFAMISKPKVIAGVVAAGGVSGAQASTGILGSGITWGDVGNFIADLVVPGGISEMGSGALYGPGTRYNSYQDYSNSIRPSAGGAAGGGFLLYPNKANTNMMQSVYSK